jgi:small subunit ribosomal protein S19
MTRSLYKPNHISNDIIRKLKYKTVNLAEPLIIKTRSRNTVINADMIGIDFEIHNGKNFSKFTVTHPDMIGHRLGEFVFTKRMGSFLHKQAHAERVKKKKQKLLAQKQSKKKVKTKKK